MMGLDIPEAVKLAKELRKKGLEIPEEVVDEEGLADAVVAIAKRK